MQRAIADSSGFSVAGGGDTLAAIEKYRWQQIDYVSTGGGAFLRFWKEKNCPTITALEERAMKDEKIS